MKPKAPKKKDTKPNCKTGKVKEESLNIKLDKQFKSLSDILLDTILKDLDISKMKPSKIHSNGLPIYYID